MNTPKSKSPVETIEVTMTAEQATFFQQVARRVGSSVGDLLLALGSDRLRLNPVCSEPATEIQSYLWIYCAEGQLPDVDSEWSEIVSDAHIGHAPAAVAEERRIACAV